MYIIVPLKVFIYRSFICYMTTTETPPGLIILDGTTTISGCIIVKYLNNDEYMCMKEIIEKIKMDKKQNWVLDESEELTINTTEITFSNYMSFWITPHGPLGAEYVEDQLKEIIDMYYTQINQAID